MPQRARRQDSRQLVRQWALLNVLSRSARSLSVRELAAELHTSKSSVERDLATLERHFPLIEEAEGRQLRRYRIDRVPSGSAVMRLSLIELLALEAADALVGSALGAPLHLELRSAIHKVRGLVATRRREHTGVFGEVFAHHPRGRVDYAPHADVIDSLVDAIVRRRVCLARYRAAWNAAETTRELWPLRLLAHDGALYALCFAPESGGVRTFAVHRFVDVDLLSRAFSPPDVDLDVEMRRAFGVFSHRGDEAEVEVMFSAQFAWMVAERMFHPDESKECLPDGRLRYTVRSSAKWEIIPWVLRFGGEAELVTPTDWREELRQLADRLHATHGAA